MFEYGYDEPSTFAQALQRLAKLRRRERVLRAALWVWAVATIVWVLPIGSWSAANLPAQKLGAAGLALAAAGGALMIVYRSLSRVRVFDASSVDTGVLGLAGFAAPRAPVSAARSASDDMRIGRRR
jgi:hypothetical protein